MKKMVFGAQTVAIAGLSALETMVAEHQQKMQKRGTRAPNPTQCRSLIMRNRIAAGVGVIIEGNQMPVFAENRERAIDEAAERGSLPHGQFVALVVDQSTGVAIEYKIGRAMV